ncbi:hypothetical protein VNI00_016298 [Paramarasmius palmivorus]|uniref:Polyketide synthase n=1 Tax=Paramarasmius palmivorus TaxID=297713 RepID=A0AAW0BEI1_9AGAR
MAERSLPINISLFAGQGTAAADSAQTIRQAIADSHSPAGSILLAASHDAFHRELESLSPSERSELDIQLVDFPTPETLLSIPHPRYRYNPVISGSSLFLIQSLRYLAYAEATVSSPAANLHHVPHGDQTLSEVLGFSSGILPACLVATSISPVTYLARAAELYRLAIWIGIRAQFYRRDEETCIPAHDRSLSSWSIAFLGLTPALAKEVLEKFGGVQDQHSHGLVITAVTDENCITVSGRPDILHRFAEYVKSIHGQTVTAHETTLRTLYHSPSHILLRQQILDDARQRQIAFPNYDDIIIPIRSSSSGEAITRSTPSAPGSPLSLLHAIIDMLVLQPVNWDVVTSRICDCLPLPAGAEIQILNFGPGGGLASSTERGLQRHSQGNVRVMDCSRCGEDGAPEKLPKHEPIAIVGMAVNLPGAPSIAKLWEVLEKGLNTVREIPEQRFKISDYDGRNPKRQMKAHTGNFIDGADEFDNTFFKISPREARSMDPQQRILLQTAYEALEDSGYVPNISPSFAPETFGCYVGATAHDYVHNLRNDIDVYYSTGTLNAFLCGRISYVMQLSGPSMVLDTACSSSSVAFYQACRALSNRDCNAALAGGINIISSPDLFLGLDRAHFLSPTGQCQAFDSSADGYSRSEGCGMFVLKRLSDAVVDHDNILGVIRGIEVNQSGKASSITHPHSETQAHLFRSLLDNAGITDPLRINVVEAHGTGTQAGDPNELESIRRVLCANRPPDNPLHVTSIKANIGHVETASGAAGLAKLLLMFQHQTIPRQISLRNLNPKIIPLEADNTIIDRTPAPWIPSHPGLSRLALLNNFGAAGSNVAMLVEEYTPTNEPPPSGEAPLLFGLSAKDQNTAEALRARYLDWLETSGKEHKITDVAYTMTARRPLYPYRIAVCASSAAELAEKLKRAHVVHALEVPKVVFVFSGQGGQYLRMGQPLYETSVVFRRAVDECHNILLELGFPGVLAIILAHPDRVTMDSLTEQEAYQTSVFALQYALGKLWMSLGVKPIAVVGHSLGEYAALYFADVLSLRGALVLVAHRARLMFEKCQLDATGMLAVNLSPEQVQKILTSHFSELTIACFNSPHDCVVAGSTIHLSLLKAYLDKEVGSKSSVISVPFGYHSEAMIPIQSALSAVASDVDIAPPTIPVVSNVHGTVVLPGDGLVFDASYFARHCVEPVKFDSGVSKLVKSCELTGNDIWIEIGPHPTTLPMLKSNPIVPKEASLVPSLRKKQEAWLTLMTAISLLYPQNISLRLHEAYAHIDRPSCISLPSYPFSRKKFWVPFTEEHLIPSNTAEYPIVIEPSLSQHSPSVTYTLVKCCIQHSSKGNGYTAIFETPVDVLAPLIAGHKVGGTALCPASVFMEIALCAVELSRAHLPMHSSSDSRHTILRKVEFVKPLTLNTSVCSVRITVAQAGDYGTFKVTSGSQVSEDILHAKGDFRIQQTARTAPKLQSFLPYIHERVSRITSNTKIETLYTRVAYNVLFPRVVDYGREYHGIEHVSSVLDGDEGYAYVKLPSSTHSGSFLAHPVLIDCLLHVSGFIVNLQADMNQGYICHAVGSLKILPELIRTGARHLVYCRTTWSSDKAQAYSEVWAQQDYDSRQILLHAKDVAFKRVRLDVLRRSLALGTSNATPRSPPHAEIPLSTRQGSPHAAESVIPDDVENPVLCIVSETCGMEVSAISVSSNFDSLGVDSLMSIELLERLKVAFPAARLDHDLLSHCATIADLIGTITAGNTDASCAPSSPPVTEDSPVLPPTPQSIDSEPRAEIEQDPIDHIRQELAAALNVPPFQIQHDTDFDSLGLDSLASIEVLHEIKTKYNLDLPDDVFTRYCTLNLLRNYLSNTSPKLSTIEDDLAIQKMFRLGINPRPCQNVSFSKKAPVFLIHDGSGLANYYERLHPLDRPVWAVYNPKFMTSGSWANLTEMADVYADFILNTVRSGAVIIGGWSFGSVAAYETAIRLRRKAGVKAIHGLLLIDPPNPINHVPMSGSLVQNITERSIVGGRSARTQRVRQLVQSQFSMNAKLLGAYDVSKSAAVLQGTLPRVALLRSKDGYMSPRKDIIVPEWLADRSDPNTARQGWEEVSSKLKMWDIPGNHFEPFQPGNIAEVSVSMSEACEYLEDVMTM